MMRGIDNNSERGTAVLEFALTAAFFFMMIVAIVSGSVLFFTHNALVESTRRGARYAAMHCKPGVIDCPDSASSLNDIRNMVLYGTTTPAAGTTPLVAGLQPSNVTVEYSVNTALVGELPNDFGIGRGTVSVKIENYDYYFAIGGLVIHMPPYKTTVMGESAGYIPGVTCPNP